MITKLTLLNLNTNQKKTYRMKKNLLIATLVLLAVTACSDNASENNAEELSPLKAQVNAMKIQAKTATQYQGKEDISAVVLPYLQKTNKHIKSINLTSATEIEDNVIRQVVEMSFFHTSASHYIVIKIDFTKESPDLIVLSVVSYT